MPHSDKVVLLFTLAQYNYGVVSQKGAAATLLAGLRQIRAVLPTQQIVSFLNIRPEVAEDLHISIASKCKYADKEFSLWDCFISATEISLCLAWRALGSRLPHLLRVSRKLREIAEADMVISLNFDRYSESLGFFDLAEQCKEILAAVLLRKPVVLYGVTIGPFISRVGRWISRLALRRVSLIILREPASKGELDALGIHRPDIYVTADPLFSLYPFEEDKPMRPPVVRRVLSHSPRVGIIIGTVDQAAAVAGLSSIAFLRRNLYSILQAALPERLFELLGYFPLIRSFRRSLRERLVVKPTVHIITHLIEKYNSKVVLIPYKYLFDDKHTETQPIERVILDRLGYPADKVSILDTDKCPDEFVTALGTLDLLLTTRFHAACGAISQGIPVVCIQPYSHKFPGLFISAGIADCITPSDALDDILAVIDYAFQNYREIQERVMSYASSARDQAQRSATLVQRFLDEHNKALQAR